MPLDLPVSRREFLRASAAAGAAAFAAPALVPAAPADRRCIFLLLTGGPSHLDTFDPKPDAPGEVRGPFRTIRTSVPGLFFSELLPRTAARAHRLAVIRSLHHHEAPIHETGQQLLQTGRLCRGADEAPHFGAAVVHELGGMWAVLPGPLGDTGVNVSHGQTAGPFGGWCGPWTYGPSGPTLSNRRAGDAERYGANPFGRNCADALGLIEAGVTCVVVNMFSTVYETLSWDCHADGGILPTDLNDYRDVVCPTFDQAFTALLDDLHDRGLLDSTLVVAAGEFGRTPYLNPRGGRDHWPGVWSALLAGGGVRGGRVVGASDRLGGEPKDRPVTLPEVVATVFGALGIDPATRIPTADGRSIPLVDAAPIRELF